MEDPSTNRREPRGEKYIHCKNNKRDDEREKLKGIENLKTQELKMTHRNTQTRVKSAICHRKI